MHIPLHCLALRATAVSDSKTLLSVWSREAGRLTLAFPAGGGREARRRKALSTPLALFEGCCDLRPGREVQSLRDFAPSAGSPALAPFSVVRGVLATFLGEVLDLLLRRCAPDSELSEYLFEGVRKFGALDSASALANFHIVFLYGLSRPLGIAPSLDGYARGAVFDLREACFRTTAPLHSDYLEADEARLLPLLSRLTLDNMQRLRLDRVHRRRILDGILQFYAIHLGDLPLRSLEILVQALE